jgi:predicted DNA-binding transcriptional regulator AlpA
MNNVMSKRIPPNTNAMAHDVLSKKQLAAHLGRSTRWIDRRIREGLPRVGSIDRFGRDRVRFRLGDVAFWLEARASVPKAERRDRTALVAAQLVLLVGRVDELTAEIEALWLRVATETQREPTIPTGENATR